MKQAEATARLRSHLARLANCPLTVVQRVCCAEQVAGLTYQPAMENGSKWIVLSTFTIV